MIRATVIASAVAAAGLYTYVSKGTFDAEAIQRAEAERPRVLTSAAHQAPAPQAVAGARYRVVSLPQRVTRSKEGAAAGRLRAVRQRTHVVSQAVVQPLSADTQNSVLKFAEINPQAVAVMLQSELKRVGCYAGPLNGEWGRLSENAVARFNKHAGTALSVETPEGPAVVTVRRHQGRVCPSPCAFGRVRGVDGKCYSQNARRYRPVDRQAAIQPAPLASASGEAAAPYVPGTAAAVPSAANRTWRPSRVKKQRAKRRSRARSRRAWRKRYRRYQRRRIFNEAFGPY